MKFAPPFALCVAAMVAPSTAHAVIWFEVGDAGQNGPSQAQVPIGSGPLNEIQGELDPGSDVDVYQILITDYQNFYCYGNGPLDTMLWLFKPDGTGQVANDDWDPDGDGQNIQYGGVITSQGLTSNGVYYLGISRFNNRPLDAANEPIFGRDVYPGPDPQQWMPNPLAGAFDHWTGTANGPGGVYKMRFTGGGFVPAPGALALLGLAGLARSRRRR